MLSSFAATINPGRAAGAGIGLSGVYTWPDNFKAPVLDLYGENDLPAVLQNADRRENELVSQVRLFLDQRLK